MALFTDFGATGPYLGQVVARLLEAQADLPVIDLLSNAPGFEPKAASFLLAGLVDQMPEGTLFLSVVDPGVGGERRALIVETEKHWFVGPDNGLLSVAAKRGGRTRYWFPEYEDSGLSRTFHGRDLFAPLALDLILDRPVSGRSAVEDEVVGWDWPSELDQVIYFDHYGNAYTGIFADRLKRGDGILVNGHTLSYARTFSEVPVGTAFWYVNSCGLVEIAVNQGDAAKLLGISQGMAVERLSA